jgi:hypothetical protein
MAEIEVLKKNAASLTDVNSSGRQVTAQQMYPQMPMQQQMSY